jgi:predicted component of type VI protein secretion system
MDAKLIVLRGADRIEIELFLPFLIGRSSDAALKIPHESVSREHCRIYEFDGELAVRDLGSRNGTYVNGQPIDKPTFLSPGDELTIGGITFRADYTIRRQVVLAPHETDASAVAGDGPETVVQPALGDKPVSPVTPVTHPAANKVKVAKTGSKPTSKKRTAAAAPVVTSSARKHREGQPSDPAAAIPPLESPRPTVADIPVLDVGEVKTPIVDKIELETEAPVELVSEDELKGFLDELS